jgi:N-acetylmuramoyl-L-alanine amidase
LKIAIDPGHIGGVVARREARYIDFRASEKTRGQALQFDEGSLTFLTAKLLQERLSLEGAQTLITRQGIGYAADGRAYSSSDAALSPEDLNQDLQLRAQKINAFNPHLSIIIHYNASAGHDREGFSVGTAVNYNVTFIPGGFAQDELADAAARFEWARLLLTDAARQSHRLAAAVAAQFTHVLNVPLMSGPYLEPFTLEVEPGVYARNLALTRLIHGPLVYGETLLQDNFTEAQLLAEKDLEVKGVTVSTHDTPVTLRTSSRLQQVAEAYFRGITAFLEEQCSHHP